MLNRQAIEKGIGFMVEDYRGSGGDIRRLGGQVALFCSMARSNGVAKGYSWTRIEHNVFDAINGRMAKTLTLVGMKDFKR